MMAYPANLANLTHATPATAARMDYLGAMAAGSHSADDLAVLSRLADEADAAIATVVTAPAEPSSPAPPTSLGAWRPYIPEYVDQSFAPAPRGHCECPAIAHIVLHIAECAQKVGGWAQPFGPDTCAEYGFDLNKLVDAVTLGAALRGITVQGLPLAMELEAEDRQFSAALTRGRTAEELAVRAANVQAYIDDPSVRAEFDRDQAELEDTQVEAEGLFETLRKRMSVEDYDRLFDELDIADPDAVMRRLRAEVAALPAPAAPFTVPPAPGAPTSLATPDQMVIAEMVNEEAPAESGRKVLVGQALLDHLDELERQITGKGEYASPAMDAISRAGRAHGAGFWGLLGAVMPRVAATIPPHVRLVPFSGRPGAKHEGVSLNIYSNLIGRKGDGKTLAMTTAEALVATPEHCSEVPCSTAEGLVKAFGEMKRRKSDKNAEPEDATDLPAAEGVPEIHTLGGDKPKSGYEMVHYTDTVIMEVDEGGDQLAEITRRGSKLESATRSAWMGRRIGTGTGELERRTNLDPHSYRLGIIAGFQPHLALQLFLSGDAGGPQRYLWSMVHVRTPSGDPISNLSFTPVQWGGSPATQAGELVEGGPRPVWISRPPAAQAAMDAETAHAYETRAQALDPAWVSERDEDADLEGHEILSQLKITALIAVMNGRCEPTDHDWYAAGVVLAASTATMLATRRVALAYAKIDDARGGERTGQIRAAAKVAELAAASEMEETVQKKILAKLCLLPGHTGTFRDITYSGFSKSQRAVAKTLMPRMADPGGQLAVDPSTRKYRLL
ncbi:hypothetical protein [Mycobacteroides abscessus]|uniref:hypothetical protein n=1 Tax=Mycobacteroides abscessus TaxID=36809 RepID=UPI00092934BF|nr:hypothetical protein [Mycobacteroides abscessus]SIN36748.1 bifunctional DNA primase/polymerase domain protein [Mycobacteroides abscessus subsp. abscessus]